MLDSNTYGIQVNSLMNPQKPITGNAKCTAANTNYDVPTSPQAIITPGNNLKGAQITGVTALAEATDTATELQLFTSPDGVNFAFADSTLLSAYTVAQTTGQTKATFSSITPSTPMILQAGEGLYACIGVANATGIRFRAQGGAY